MAVAGLVAAAGRSSRMGRPKALLPFGEETFAARLLRVFRDAGLAPVLVTIPEPPDDDAVRTALRGIDAVLVGSSRVDLQACKLEYSIVSPK